MTRSYIALTVQKRELTLENPFLNWKGLLVKFGVPKYKKVYQHDYHVKNLIIVMTA